MSFVGEPVAIVIGDTRYVAEDAAALVAVDYDVLPAATDCRPARDEPVPAVRRELSSNQIMSYKVAYGDVAAAFAGAAHVLRDQLWIHRGGAHSMEGRGILAQISDRELTVWASTQKAHDLMHALAEFIDLDEGRLRVATPDVGGGFGPKLCVYPEDVAVVAAATLLHRSVKWIEDRREHFTNAVQERDQYWTIEIAADADGRVRGVRGHLAHDLGAYALQDVNLPYNSATSLTGPYVVPALAMDVVVAHTNKTPVSSVRGAGYPQAAFAMERLMDRLARALDLDRAELRRRNLIPAEKMPYLKPLKARSGEQVQYDSGDYPGCQAEILKVTAWDDFPRRQAPSARARPLSRHRSRARPQRNGPRSVRIRQCPRIADRPHHRFNRRRADGTRARDGARADLRRCVRCAGAGRHHRGRRHRGGAAWAWRFRQPPNGHRGFVGAYRGEISRSQGAQACQSHARGRRGGS